MFYIYSFIFIHATLKTIYIKIFITYRNAKPISGNGSESLPVEDHEVLVAVISASINISTSSIYARRA